VSSMSSRPFALIPIQSLMCWSKGISCQLKMVTCPTTRLYPPDGK
jgi:hypothetical protein